MSISANERKCALIIFKTFLCFLSISDLANKCSDCNDHEEGKSQRNV